MRDIVDRICSFEGRAPCSDAERRAASWLHDELRRHGHEAWVETYWVRPQWAWSIALACALAVGGSVLAPTQPEAGLACAAVAAIHLGIESFGRPGPLRWLFFRRATQNVIVLPREDDRIALWICARYDAPRRGLAASLLPLLRPWLASMAGVIAATAAARVTGAEGVTVGLVQFVPTIVVLLALAGAVETALSGVSPGAQDNASSVAVALEAFDELTRHPPRRLAPALLLHGAGEGDPLGLRAHLNDERPVPEENVFVDLQGAEADPRWATRQPQLIIACEGAGGRRVRGAVSYGGVPTALVGGPGPLSRSREDLPERLGDETLEATLDFFLALVEDLDAELAAHEATLPKPARRP